MKTEGSDPPRLGVTGPDPLREFVRSARGGGPTGEAAARMSKRLVTTGILPTTAPLAKDALRPEQKIAYYKIGFAALAVVGGFAFSWREMQASSGAPTPVTVRAADRSETEPAKTPTVEPREGSSNGASPSAVSVADLPSAVRPLAPAISTRVSGSASVAAGAEPALSEVEIVHRARTALVSDPQRALRLANEHSRTYPAGEFVQEREVIAVEALARMGRKDEGLRRARALIERFPRTPYAGRLEVAIGQPFSENSNTRAPASADGAKDSHSAPSP